MKDESFEAFRSRLEIRESLLKDRTDVAQSRGDSTAEATYVLTREIMEIEQLLSDIVLILGQGRRT
jgi:hypothetical protein